MRVATIVVGVSLVSPVWLSDGCEPPPVDNGQPAVLEHDAVFTGGSPVDEPIPPGAEIDPLSDQYVARMVTEVGIGGLLMTTNDYTYPVYYADQTTPRYDVGLTVYGTYGYCGKSVLEDVPIPEFAVQDPNTDAHMVIVDRSTACVYDFWGYGQNPNVGLKTSWWASALPSDGDGIYESGPGAGYAGNFAALNGIVWPDEIEAGYIGHALSISYMYTAVAAGGPVPPATHSDGSSTDADALPEGARLQLDPDLDLDTLELSPAERAVARAMQEYGMFVMDGSGGGVRVSAVSGLSTYPNAWIGVVPEGDGKGVWLPNIPVERFRVLRLPERVTPEGGCVNNRCQIYR